MKIIIEYQGKTYEGAEMKSCTHEEAVDILYKDFEKFSKFQMDLECGGTMIIGQDVLRSCVIKILDT